MSGNSKIDRKSSFQTLENTKSTGIPLSRLWKQQNRSKCSFPDSGKHKIDRNAPFQTLETTKSIEIPLSRPWKQ